MPQTSEAQNKQRMHDIIERAFDLETDTRVVFLVYEQQALSIQALGFNDEEELRKLMFHGNAMLEGAIHNHPTTMQ